MDRPKLLILTAVKMEYDAAWQAVDRRAAGMATPVAVELIGIGGQFQLAVVEGYTGTHLDGVLMAGFAGGLNPVLAVGDVVIDAASFAAERVAEILRNAPGSYQTSLPGKLGPLSAPGNGPVVADGSRRGLIPAHRDPPRAGRATQPSRPAHWSPRRATRQSPARPRRGERGERKPGATGLQPRVYTGPILTCDAPLATPAEKRRRFEASQALAVDMENEPTRRWATGRNLPWLGLRVISDAADETLEPQLLRLIDPRGQVRWMRLVRALVGRPQRLGPLLRLARNSRLAATNLANAVGVIVNSGWPF